MSERVTLARPYAEAAFSLAQERKDLGKWSQMLRLLSSIVGDAQMQTVIGNPRITRERVAGLAIDVGGSEFNKEAHNFIRLLAQNQRLQLAPEISELFDALKADVEKTVEAEVVSAVKLDDKQIQTIAAALKKRLGREVHVQATVDASLVGGAVIRAGDLVIDGSVTGRLRALETHLKR